MLSGKTGHLAAGGGKSSTDPAWAHVALDLADIAPLLTGRDGIKVHIGLGLVGREPGCFSPSTKTIELDAYRCFPDIDPASINLTDMRDHHRYQAGLGVFAHECAHAAHTRWRPGPAWTALTWNAGALLEDLRAESAQISRRPVDRAWLRSASVALDIPDLDRTPLPAASLWQAATAAALCLGRVDAGVLAEADTGVAEARDALTESLGPDLLANLEALWRQALGVADADGPAMLALARAWCRLLTRTANAVGATGKERQDELAAAVWAATDALEAAATPPPINAIGGGTSGTPTEPPCSDLFAYTAPPKRSRAATGPERAAAARLAKALAEAARSPRTATTVHTQAPPGRLHMRGALAGAAQRAAGVPVTAKPWQRTKHKRSPDPAAKIGIALDVSGSMNVFFTPATTAAWMIARAAKQTGGNAAAATFGERVRTLIAPGKVPERIPEPMVEWNTVHLDVVIDALDAALGLGIPDQHARLLFMITDGFIGTGLRWKFLEQCERLQQAGCAVIQITPDLRGGMEACHIIEAADPTAAIKAITDAVTAELRAAARRQR